MCVCVCVCLLYLGACVSPGNPRPQKCLCVCVCQALLRFEELQGSVVNRKLMSRQQIDRFPTRTFSPAPNAAPNAAAAQ